MNQDSYRFPATRVSVVDGVSSDDSSRRERATAVLVAVYWKPVYKYLRLKWRRTDDDAADLTQEFFLAVIQKGYLESYDPHRARLRTFLRTCLDRLVQNHDRAARAVKRGGGVQPLALDFETAEGELSRTEIPEPAAMEDYFEREWSRSLFERVVETLRTTLQDEGKAAVFTVFERHDLADENVMPSYGDLAASLDLPVSTVTNHLAQARRTFRRIALEQLREMTGSEAEFREEARSLLGVVVP